MNTPHPFTAAILTWFAENRRDLPWRHTRDPYAIWLSEVILQQTRINQGMDYWLRFMKQWPTVQKLAAASEDEVLRMWQGLGYYSRARHLHEAAQQIVAQGNFPHSFDDLCKLKGVGNYTAAAIASIAFSQPVAVVDGNVYRVLARVFGIDTPINSTEGKRTFAELAQSLLPEAEASDYNQAMMDFGAIQCTPVSPRCLLCPLTESCEALRQNKIDTLPVKLKTTKIKTRHLNYIYIRCKGETAIHRRPSGDIWQGLWEPLLYEEQSAGKKLPSGEIQSSTQILASYENQLTAEKLFFNINLLSGKKQNMLNYPVFQLLRKNVKHVLTHRILMADFYLLEMEEKPTLPPDFIWISEADIDKYALPRLIELLLEALPKD